MLISPLKIIAAALTAGAIVLSVSAPPAHAFGLKHCKQWGKQNQAVNPIAQTGQTASQIKVPVPQKVQAQSGRQVSTPVN